jgi:hypothetical protein
VTAGASFAIELPEGATGAFDGEAAEGVVAAAFDGPFELGSTAGCGGAAVVGAGRGSGFSVL